MSRLESSSDTSCTISGKCLCPSIPYALTFSFTSEKWVFRLRPLPAPRDPGLAVNDYDRLDKLLLYQRGKAENRGGWEAAGVGNQPGSDSISER